MDSLSIPRFLKYWRRRFPLSSDSWIYLYSHNFDSNHTLNYDLHLVETVILDYFAIFTMKKSNLDSWQVAIAFAFAAMVTFMASSYSCCLVAMFTKPYFVLLLGSNFSTNNENYIWISLKYPCCCFCFGFDLFRFGLGGVFVWPILSFLKCCLNIDFECFEFEHFQDCSCCNFTACSSGIDLQDNSCLRCTALRTCSSPHFDPGSPNFPAWSSFRKLNVPFISLFHRSSWALARCKCFSPLYYSVLNQTILPNYCCSGRNSCISSSCVCLFSTVQILFPMDQILLHLWSFSILEKLDRCWCKSSFYTHLNLRIFRRGQHMPANSISFSNCNCSFGVCRDN